MKNRKLFLKDAIFSLVTLVVTFILNLLIQQWLHIQTLIPMIFVFLAVLAFNFLGDGLRDALDPKLKK